MRLAFLSPAAPEERCVNRRKQWRGLAARYEKRVASYQSMAIIAAIVLSLDS